MVIREALSRAQADLAAAGIPSARLDAQVLLMHALSCGREYLILHGEDDVPPARERKFFEMVRRRQAFEPVAYLTGHKEFYSLDFCVEPGVLIPRPDTETLVETVLQELCRVARPRIVDIGTGSGAIAVTLAHLRPDAVVDALDVSDTALRVAAENARRLVPDERVCVRRFDVLEEDAGVLGPYDVVVSNPPYIRLQEMDGLMPDVRLFEPHVALCGGPDGLAFYRAIIKKFVCILKFGGFFAFETGDDTAEPVRALLEEAKLHSVEMFRDLAGNRRVVVARKAGD